jgi:membrane-bound lytic murein transglycosylase D
MRLRWILTLAVGGAALAADSPPPPPPDNTDALLQIGQQLFDEYAPPEVKDQYSFPTREDLDRFADQLQRALDGESLDHLAALEPQARAALTAAQAIPGTEDYTGWLALRLDEIDAARQALRPPATGGPLPPSPSPIPHYGLWLGREHGRPEPAGAAELMPRLRAAFAAEGVPPELAWLAEVESNLNPEARSPAGARGLFQLMPETAHNLGLSLFLPDERTDPAKSARAAAHYLRLLHDKFGSWPLALAAYNAGEGRVSRLLADRKATDFAGIAAALPAETRMYVPKVCALVSVRTGTVL